MIEYEKLYIFVVHCDGKSYDVKGRRGQCPIYRGRACNAGYIIYKKIVKHKDTAQTFLEAIFRIPYTYFEIPNINIRLF